MGDARATGNLCQSEQNSRLRASLISTVVGLGAIVVLDRLHTPLWYRIAAFIPFYLAASWLLQALGKT